MARLLRIILLILLPLALAAFLLRDKLPFFAEAAPEPDPPALASLPSYEVLELEEYEVLGVLHLVGECRISHYDACVICCGKADGITATGTRAAPYETCAVDPRVIPLGSVVRVVYSSGETRVYRAEDTGSGVRGNHIDVCVSSHREARSLGVRRGTVYWEEPAE